MKPKDLDDAILRAHRVHVWPPYTSSEDHEQRDPAIVVGAEGAWLELADGRRILDGNASWWVSALGHRHPRLVAALSHAIGRLDHVAYGGLVHEDAALLSQELVACAPRGLSRVHFSDDGSTAVEVALKIAAQYWAQNGAPSRKRFIALAGAYHGDTVGAVSLGGVPAFRRAYGALTFDVVRAPDPDASGGWELAVSAIVDEMHRSRNEIAGVFVEPLVQGAAGMRMWPADLLRVLFEATRTIDTFLIADEVFTGFGRTGTMWACDAGGITPDLMCLSKALAGGMIPMGATLATERVYDGFRGGSDRALMHGHSFFGNPLGAALAREVLAFYRGTSLLEDVKRKATKVERVFSNFAQIPGVFRPRALGMIGAVDLGERGYEGRAGWDVYDRAMALGAYLRPLGDTVYITPPLNIEDRDLDSLLAIVDRALRTS